jgi:hypothetical protein
MFFDIQANFASSAAVSNLWRETMPIRAAYEERPPVLAAGAMQVRQVGSKSSDVYFVLGGDYQGSVIDRLGSFEDTIAFLIEKNSNDKAMAESTKKWKYLLLNPNSAADLDALTETVDSLFDSIEDFGAAAVDLRGLDAAQVQPDHLAAILRATATVHDQVPGWAVALKVAEDAFVSLGQDPGDALFGLI